MTEPTDAAADRESLGSGPRKTRSRRPPPLVFTTHKERSRWFRQREAWPYREPSAQALAHERARLAAELPPAPGTEAWEFAGPANIGGRMTALVCDPNDADRLLAGAAGGGVWRSRDGGRSWESLWHREPTLNVGALALDPHDPALVYCGTGEANLSADSHPGVGVFVSRDAGESWSLLADAAATGLPTRIGSIAVDPFDPRHVRLGGVSHGTGSDGMYFSRDGGLTWQRDDGVSGGSYRCHQIAFDPTTQGTIFATVTARGTLSGVWRSRDGGQSWEQPRAGLPDPSRIGRGSLALAPSNPRVIYLQLAQARFAGSTDGVLGLFRSADGGDGWSEVGGNHFARERQMSYNNTIAVHPTDPDHVLCGGVDIHRTRDGGGSWRRVTDWAAERGQRNYAHADQHALVMPTARPGTVYAANDGGLDVSEDGGTAWANRSDGLAVTMFYDLEVAQSDRRVYGGGCQDNGTNLTVSGRPDDHFMVTGGDGGWLTIDPNEPAHLFTSAQHMVLFRHRPGDGWKRLELPASASERALVWMMFIAMDPGDSRRVYVGGERLWRSDDDGDNWTDLSGALDGSPITAVEIARADRRRLYVGTENGGVFRSRDGGATWSGDLAGPVLPGRTITRLKTDPADADLLYASVANFMTSNVFRSLDGGATWEDVDRGRLPRVPHNSLALSPRHPGVVIVCNDVGVLASKDGGDNWLDLTRDLPNVMVVDLVWHEADDVLFAATYGRSIWRLDLRGFLAGG